MATSRKPSYSLTVPIEVSKTPDTAGAVKVAIVDESGRVLQSQVVKTSGKPVAKFELSELPRNARVVVGPEDADDEALPKLESVSAPLPSRLFARGLQATLSTILIPPYYWPIWRRWCRDFVITGTVICPNGRPVPGAQVCAFDVDWFWIWQSKQQIGCAITDANGHFQIRFRWCCGWYPWWWWYLRNWQIDLRLADDILKVLPPELKIKPIPLPDPIPDLRMIEELIPPSRLPKNLKPAPPIIKPRITAAQGEAEDEAQVIETLKQTTTAFFERAEALRPVLAELIPPVVRIPDLWPWYPWYPWRDCNPDVLFQVTQPCDGEFKVIVDQNYSQTQWNIPEAHNVTLVANSEACCTEDTPCGDPCLSITHVCDIGRASVDQTTGSPTAGLAFPGAATAGNKTNADRPFAGTIYVQGLPECMGEDVDWYEVESSQYNPGTGTWSPYTPIPITSLGAFSRSYFTPMITPPWSSRTFAPTTVAGKTVYPSRKNLEASLPPIHVCYGNCHILFSWVTSSAAWADGTYRLRLRPYKEQPAGTLVLQTLPPCHPDEPNEIVITLDNRPSPDPFHVVATTPNHPCGSGTVHTCTTEPDVDVEAVRLRRADGTFQAILPCGIYQRQAGDSMEIDFLADDRSEHLAWYSLIATYGENAASNLLTGTTLAPNAAGVAVGPAYWDAIQPVLNQGATAPSWRGGRITVTIPPAQMALKFPDPCCYQLELRAYKRTILSCDTRFLHDNLAEYSFFY